MFPILPTPGLQAEAHHERYAPDNEEAYAQKHGRVVRPFPAMGRPSRARMILFGLGVIITLAAAAFIV
jgi:hypothetical protein